jgi:5-methylcytosine-specific restriction endonuclease McrA
VSSTKPLLGQCELCGRTRQLTFHHLIPRKNHGKRRFQRRFAKEEMKERGLWICRLCHRQLHRFFSEEELGQRLNSREAILADPDMQRFVRWARKQRSEA